ncbi:MAG: ABC transporter permease [Bacilli bacterium]|nr:ABC transporter permease [Bacilli bacterium]
MKQTLAEIYDYRQMIVGLVRRDLRGRYKGSVLGFLWTFINPLLQLLVYTLVFGVLFENNAKPNFYLYVFVGLIPWIFFSSCLTGGCGAVLDQSGLVTKVYFPREVLPISYVTSQFVNMLYCFVIVIAVYIFGAFSSVDSAGFIWGLREGFSFLPLLSLPLLFIIQYLMCLGMTLFTSAITVYVRDVRHILGILGMLWMFATPLMWFKDTFDGHRTIQTLLICVNPMGGLIEGYHNILYYGKWPDFVLLAFGLAWAILALIVGTLVFNKAKKRFAEEM